MRSGWETRFADAGQKDGSFQQRRKLSKDWFSALKSILSNKMFPMNAVAHRIISQQKCIQNRKAS